MMRHAITAALLLAAIVAAAESIAAGLADEPAGPAGLVSLACCLIVIFTQGT